jgi:hypothetical protein
MLAFFYSRAQGVRENGVIEYFSFSANWTFFATCMRLIGLKSITFRRNKLLATSFVVPVLEVSTKLAL